MTPQRIQLRRTKGWRMPPNTTKVDRSTRWGNPYSHQLGGRAAAVERFRKPVLPAGFWSWGGERSTIDDVRRELVGKNLACWCPLDEPCHADVLLEIANV
jgi:hypothetical protein